MSGVLNGNASHRSTSNEYTQQMFFCGEIRKIFWLIPNIRLRKLRPFNYRSVKNIANIVLFFSKNVKNLNQKRWIKYASEIP